MRSSYGYAVVTVSSTTNIRVFCVVSIVRAVRVDSNSRVVGVVIIVGMSACRAWFVISVMCIVRVVSIA